MRIVVTKKIVLDNGMRLGCGVYNLTPEAAAVVIDKGCGYDEADGPPVEVNTRSEKLRTNRYNAECKTEQARAYDAQAREEALYEARSKARAKQDRYASETAQRNAQRAHALRSMKHG